jgi:hypothetical protein
VQKKVSRPSAEAMFLSKATVLPLNDSRMESGRPDSNRHEWLGFCVWGFGGEARGNEKMSASECESHEVGLISSQMPHREASRRLESARQESNLLIGVLGFRRLDAEKKAADPSEQSARVLEAGIEPATF